MKIGDLMRDISNLTDNLLKSEILATEFLLDKLLKSRSYKVRFDINEYAKEADMNTLSIRQAIKKMAIAEVVKCEQKSGLYVVWVTSNGKFYELIKYFGVR